MAVALAFPVASKGSGEAVKERRKQIICKVFGKRYCRQAIAVAGCETGQTFDVWAGYGKHDYWGLFQVSSYWRKKYEGFQFGAWAQSRHALKVFKADGYKWAQWECQP